MSHWDFGRRPAEQYDEPDWDVPGDGDGDGDDLDGGDDLHGSDDHHAGDAATGPLDIGDLDDGDDTGLYPITYERGRIEPDQAPFGPADAPDHGYDPNEPYEIWPPAPAPDDLRPSGLPGQPGQPPGTGWPPPPDPTIRRWSGRRGPDRRWLIAGGAAVVVAVGAAAVLLSGRHPGGASAAASPAGPAATASSAARATSAATSAPTATRTTGAGGAPLTLAQAQAVLAGFVAADNQANASRAKQALTGIETGSSLAIDVSRYRTARGTVPVPAPVPAYTLASATCYLPRSEPGAGPHWFVAQIGIATVSQPTSVTSVRYLLFLQNAAGGQWRDAIEPVVLPGTAAPVIAVGGDGLATAVPIGAAGSLAAAPVRLPALTASALDAATASGAAPVIPANVPDRQDQRAWQARAPMLTITDRHAPATAGQAFALRTSDGGALVLYTVAATMTITPQHPGRTFRLYVPGFYAPGQQLRTAAIQYRDQFAAYDPPARAGQAGRVTIIADRGGITRRI